MCMLNLGPRYNYCCSHKIILDSQNVKFSSRVMILLMEEKVKHNNIVAHFF